MTETCCFHVQISWVLEGLNTYVQNMNQEVPWDLEKKPDWNPGTPSGVCLKREAGVSMGVQKQGNPVNPNKTTVFL